MSQPETSVNIEAFRPIIEIIPAESDILLEKLEDCERGVETAQSDLGAAAEAHEVARLAHTEASSRYLAEIVDAKRATLDSDSLTDFQKVSVLTALGHANQERTYSLSAIAEDYLKNLKQIDNLVRQEDVPILLVSQGTGMQRIDIKFFTTSGEGLIVTKYTDIDETSRLRIGVKQVGPVASDTTTDLINYLSPQVLARTITEPENIDSPELSEVLASRDYPYRDYGFLIIGDGKSMAGLIERLASEKETHHNNESLLMALNIWADAKKSGIDLAESSDSFRQELARRRGVQITKLASTAIRKLEKDPSELQGVNIIELDELQLILGITPKIIKKEIEKIHKQRTANVTSGLKKLN